MADSNPSMTAMHFCLRDNLVSIRVARSPVQPKGATHPVLMAQKIFGQCITDLYCFI